MPVRAVTRSGAPRAVRHLVLADPPEGLVGGVIHLLREAVSRGLRTIVYCQSRKLTELLAVWAARGAGALASRIGAYRAGLRPDERRGIEGRLARGDLLALITTSALELGIDIGDLDLCILVGYPGSVIATLQRAGRVGRGGRESALVVVAGEDALDRYFSAPSPGAFRREARSGGGQCRKSPDRGAATWPAPPSRRRSGSRDILLQSQGARRALEEMVEAGAVVGRSGRRGLFSQKPPCPPPGQPAGRRPAVSHRRC